MQVIGSVTLFMPVVMPVVMRVDCAVGMEVIVAMPIVRVLMSMAVRRAIGMTVRIGSLVALDMGFAGAAAAGQAHDRSPGFIRFRCPSPACGRHR